MARHYSEALSFKLAESAVSSADGSGVTGIYDQCWAFPGWQIHARYLPEQLANGSLEAQEQRRLKPPALTWGQCHTLTLQRTLTVSRHLRAAVEVLSEAKGSSCERTCERVSRLPARLWYLLGLSNWRSSHRILHNIPASSFSSFSFL